MKFWMNRIVAMTIKILKEETIDLKKEIGEGWAVKVKIFEGAAGKKTFVFDFVSPGQKEEISVDGIEHDGKSFWVSHISPKLGFKNKRESLQVFSKLFPHAIDYLGKADSQKLRAIPISPWQGF